MVVTSWACGAPPRHQIVRQPGAGGPPAAVEEGGVGAEEREDAAGEGGDKVEEEAEEGAVVAEDEVEMAEAGGGEVVEEEGGDDEQDEADDNVVVYQPLPAAQQAPKKRRRPPREVWIVNQDAARAEMPAQAPPAQQDLGRPVRIRREPDHYGIEKGREPDSDRKNDTNSDILFFTHITPIYRHFSNLAHLNTVCFMRYTFEC